MVKLDKYRDKVKNISDSSVSAARPELEKLREQLLNDVFGDMLGTEWLDDGRRKEMGEKPVEEEDDILYQYEDEIDGIGSMPASEESPSKLGEQVKRLIAIFNEIDEAQSYGREEMAEDDQPVDDEETIE